MALCKVGDCATISMLNYRRCVKRHTEFFVFVRDVLHTENKNTTVTGLGHFTIKVLVETLSLVVNRLPAKRHKNWILIPGICNIK